MRWTMPTRRRADEFAAVVDGVRPPDGSASAEARDFYAIVARLRDVDGPTLRPEFAATLREQLVAEAATALAVLPKPATPDHADHADHADELDAPDAARSSRGIRGLQAAPTAPLVCATAGGVAAATPPALPGGPLRQASRGADRGQTP